MPTPLRKNPISASKRGPDVSGEIRRHFMRALKELELGDNKKGRGKRPLWELILEGMEKNLPSTLKALSHYVPKDVLVAGDADNPIRIEVVKFGELEGKTYEGEIEEAVVKELEKPSSK